MSEGRASNGRFLPGVSGNPGGRPRNEAAQLAIGRARQLLPDAIENVWKIANDPEVSADVRLRANLAIAERVLGRPRQSLHVDIPGATRTDEFLDELSDEELRALMREQAALPPGDGDVDD